eukprot:gene8683-10201_t
MTTPADGTDGQEMEEQNFVEEEDYLPLPEMDDELYEELYDREYLCDVADGLEFNLLSSKISSTTTPNKLRSSRKNKKQRSDRRRSHASSYLQDKECRQSSWMSKHFAAAKTSPSARVAQTAARSMTPASTESYEREIRRALAMSQADYDRQMRASIALSQVQINDLLNRELTPEDYELLLRLDETVKPKTTPLSVVCSLPTISYSETYEQYPACMICLMPFENKEVLTILPKCSHIYHTNCISNWLSNASVNCPIDGLPCHER